MTADPIAFGLYESVYPRIAVAGGLTPTGEVK
jgi:hypothetical protein